MSLPNPFSKSGDTAAEETPAPAGLTRKSASKAKPVRAAGESVRVASSKPKEKLSKEAEKAERRRQREEEDRMATLTDLVMKQDESYVKLRKSWYVMIGVGFACVIISFIVMRAGGDSTYNMSTPLGVISVLSIVLAYVFIIAGIILEFVKIRPIRNKASEKVQGMSEKRRRALLAADEEERARKAAEKEARKAARKKK